MFKNQTLFEKFEAFDRKQNKTLKAKSKKDSQQADQERETGKMTHLSNS